MDVDSIILCCNNVISGSNGCIENKWIHLLRDGILLMFCQRSLVLLKGFFLTRGLPGDWGYHPNAVAFLPYNI